MIQTGHLDEVAKVISGGQAATLAMVGSAEGDQFDPGSLPLDSAGVEAVSPRQYL